MAELWLHERMRNPGPAEPIDERRVDRSVERFHGILARYDREGASAGSDDLKAARNARIASQIPPVQLPVLRGADINRRCPKNGERAKGKNG